MWFMKEKKKETLVHDQYLQLQKYNINEKN